MKKTQIDEFETLQGQLQSFHDEMNGLVRKTPNDALNKFKLGLVNSILTKANAPEKHVSLFRTSNRLMNQRCHQSAMSSSSFLNI